MRYTRRRFGEELKAQLDIGYDPCRIARWCYERYLDERDREEGLDEIMDEIYGMDAGPEFAIPEDDLRGIASSLVSKTDD